MESWLEFVDAFPSEYAELIAGDHLKRMMASPDAVADLYSSPNLVFLGANATLVRLLIDHYISAVLGDEGLKKMKKIESQYDIRCPSVQGTYEFKFMSSATHIEIDFAAHKGYEKAVISVFLSRHICAIKCMTGPKHVVVLHNVQCLSSVNINALRKVLESHASVVFILSCTNLSRLSGALLSRCMPIRCCVSPRRLDADALMQRLRGHRGAYASYDPRMSLTQNIVRNVVSAVGDGDGDGGGEEGGVRKNIRRLLAAIDGGQQGSSIKADFEGVSKLIRAFSYDMPRFHVSVAVIFREALGVMLERGASHADLVRATALAAKLQHQSVSMSKPYLAIERFFMHAAKKK